ncbi:hypothetical protein ARMGADRAFT_1029444 [Armillaria gallica]|uniref:Uncharacterized protein n=1 Tax=Armillaria gallica TaxID=47427 RepID=A0A2H3DKC0_ARMGA|nr:hypothetical protein ARMGADRAFT_1029444 [Armillaria gallica]
MLITSPLDSTNVFLSVSIVTTSVLNKAGLTIYGSFTKQLNGAFFDFIADDFLGDNCTVIIDNPTLHTLMDESDGMCKMDIYKKLCEQWRHDICRPVYHRFLSETNLVAHFFSLGLYESKNPVSRLLIIVPLALGCLITELLISTTLAALLEFSMEREHLDVYVHGEALSNMVKDARNTPAIVPSETVQILTSVYRCMSIVRYDTSTQVSSPTAPSAPSVLLCPVVSSSLAAFGFIADSVAQVEIM